MTQLRDDEYRWLQIYDLLKQRIVDGVYKPGNRVPSERQLAQEFSVDAQTARRAVRRLRAEGLVVTKPYLGNFVARPTGQDSESG